MGGLTPFAFAQVSISATQKFAGDVAFRLCSRLSGLLRAAAEWQAKSVPLETAQTLVLGHRQTVL